MSAKYCARNTNKWKELAGQTSEDVVIKRYAITGQQDLESIYAPIDTIYDSVLENGKIDVKKLNGYNAMHQTSHFKMEITNVKGEKREVLVVNPIPSSFAPIGGDNITKEQIDSNPYITVKKGNESGREYYYAYFTGYNTLQNLNDSLVNSGLAQEGAFYGKDNILDENIINEKANSLETKVKFFSEQFDDKIVNELDIENISKITGKDKNRLDYLFGFSVSKLIDLKNKYLQDINKFKSMYEKTSDSFKKQSLLDRINELEGDVNDISNLIKDLTDKEVYRLTDKLRAFSSAIELAESKAGTIVSQVKFNSKKLKNKLGHKNGGSIKAIDYIKNNETGIIPADQLSILSRQQHLLDSYTNLNEIKESISIFKSNVSDQMNNYEDNDEARKYLKSLDRLLDDMLVKIEDVESRKKGIDSDLNNMIKQTTIAVMAINNMDARAKWNSLLFSKFKKEAEDQYYKDLKTMSESKAKAKFNKTIKNENLWKKAIEEGAKETDEKIEYIFNKTEQEFTEIDDISALHAFVSQQARIGDVASQMVYNLLSMTEQKTRTEYLQDMNGEFGLDKLQEAFKNAGLSLSNFKEIISERKYLDQDGNEKIRYIITPIFKEETTDKYNEIRDRLKILKTELDDLYDQNDDIQDINARIYAQESLISVTRNLMNKASDIESRTEYKKKYDESQQELNLLKQELQEAKDKINSKNDLYKEVVKLEENLNKYKLELEEASKAVEDYYKNPKSKNIDKFKHLLDPDIANDYNRFKAVFMLSRGLYNMEQRIPFSVQNLSHKARIYTLNKIDPETGKTTIEKVSPESTLNFLMNEVVLPKVEASKVETLKNRGLKNTAEQAWKNLISIQESDRASGVAITFDVDINGDPIKKIRRNFLMPLDDGVQQSFDLINLYALESMAVNRYKNRSNMKDEMETITGVINSRNVHQKRGFKDMVTKTKFGKYTQKVFKSKDSVPNVNKVIDAMMDAHIYGLEVKSTGIEAIDNALNKLTGITALTGYVGNLLSASANFLVGTHQNFQEVFGQEYFTFKDSRLATAKTVGLLKAYYRNSFKLVDDSLLGLIFREFNLQGAFGNKFNYESKYENKVQELLFNPFTLINKITETSEFMTQAPLVVAILQGIKITNKNGEYLNKDGKVVKDRDQAQSLIDILYVKDGKLAFKKDIKDLYLSQNLNKYLDTKDQANSILWAGNSEDVLKHSIAKYIEDIMFKTQGMYNNFNSPLGKRNAWIRPAFQYRAFMDEYLRRMYGGITTLFYDMNNPELQGGRYFNPNTNRSEEGYLPTFLRWWLSRPSNHLLIKNPVIKILNKINNSMAEINREITNEAAYEKLTDTQKANLARIAYYASTNISLFFTILMLSALKEEEPDEEYIDRLMLLVRRMQNEVMFVWNPNEFLQFFTNPAAAVRTIQLITNWASTAFYTAGELIVNGEIVNGRYKNGEHKGDLKLFHRTTDLLPYASFIKFFKDENYVQDRLKFYEKTY